VQFDIEQIGGGSPERCEWVRFACRVHQ